MHKIAICEDHEIVVDGLRLILNGHDAFTLSGHARNEKELIEIMQRDQPEVLLLDLNLKTEDGFSLLERLRPRYPELKVLILTMYEEPFLIDKARKLKANGYLLKNSSNRDLMLALNHVMASENFFLPDGLQKQKQTEEKYRDEFIEKMKLTPREIEIIGLIARGKAAKEMADELFLSLFTVDTHRRNILKKLNLKNIADLVRFAYENHLVK